MKVIALGTLSGATGDREKGQEFAVDAKLGADLVGRGLVEAAPEAAPVAEKASKAKE
ncbi:hypothetical protein HX787_20220 [Pseudomonas tolaasii]|uniref:Uncharacterized protein n=1 Tax=Pseudomonas tolaasii TaxID=29442 RepID=A0A7Y8DR07_PSETO|nr:hypothetical protein [Pseudomonas tolaasii]NWC24078.1 hypothetical protein [Pseudomonas tolaasii]NWD38193.1 hypothetical protein [Pseudomonas tolaasii]